MRIFIIRHGESEKISEDTVLTRKGLIQAKNLANFLKNFKIDKAFTSNLTRAKQTLEEYKKICFGTECVISNDLNEIYRTIVGGPEKEGTPLDREEKDKQRADRFFSNLIEMKYENVAIFTHGNVIRYFISKALSIEPKGFWNKLVISPGSVSIIEKSGNLLQVKAINVISHLDQAEILDFYNGEIKNEDYFP